MRRPAIPSPGPGRPLTAGLTVAQAERRAAALAYLEAAGVRGIGHQLVEAVTANA